MSVKLPKLFEMTVTIAMNAALQQQGVELVYPLKKKMVLVKFAPGQSLGQIAARNSQFDSLKGFGFHWDLVPPVDRTSKALQQKYTHPSVTTKPATPQSSKTTALRSWPVASVIFLAIIAFLYYCLLKK